MPRPWRTLLPLALTLVLAGFIVGAVVAGTTDEPQRRAPVEMTPRDGGTTADGSSPTTQRPAQRPTRRQRPDDGVTVITPRPTMRPDDDSDDDDDDGRIERDDDDDGPDDD